MEFISLQLRNRLFNNFNKLHLGYDLLSNDINRARDAGLQTYVKYITYCFPNIVIKKWDDLLRYISEEVQIFHLKIITNNYK